ncbi:hypothetical protein A8C32_06630 [Flavivirga aquatica]|uniref:OmpA-like domain-containing protein n=1 Tax=Flavivirga aquatica TaxID=1849968 RepID=A0A1E5SIB5_9FLAO|nr:hypothetical protein A8C32_06630 [Flavivirga aquatica]
MFHNSFSLNEKLKSETNDYDKLFLKKLKNEENESTSLKLDLESDCLKEISGIVKDKDSQKPLAYTHVVIYEASDNDKIIDVVISDASGHFEFNLDCKPKTYSIYVKKLAYKENTSQLTINAEDKQPILLKFDLEQDCEKIISGVVMDKKTQEVLPNADIVVYDSNENDKVIDVLRSDELGRFKVSFACKAEMYNYGIYAKKEAYEENTTQVVINGEEKNESISLKLALDPEKQIAKPKRDLKEKNATEAKAELSDQKVTKEKVAEVKTDLFKLLGLNPIYFDFDKSFIRKDAKVELTKVINYMKKFPNVKIDVRSYTDSKGQDSYNLLLSNRRNKSTLDYIINTGGILKSRLTGKGYGETKLTNHCNNQVKCSRKEHQANRRSEFIVISN